MSYYNRTPLLPRDIGLILSYRCQSSCAHCLYNCGPDWHDWMSVDAMTRALENARLTWGAGFQVHLTGGEPFLNYPLLLEATRVASQLNIPVYVETNAGWCRDIVKAEDRFRQLYETGLDAVLVSVSPFHHETIPLKRTLDGISAARTVFGEGRVIVYQSEWLLEMSQWGLHETVPLEEYVNQYGGQQAGLRLWKGYGLISGGRAGFQLGELTHKSPPEAYQGQDCQEELLFAHHSHLDLYGNFIPAFCGGISLGDWQMLKGLVEDIRKGDYPELVRALLMKGPYGLYQISTESYGYNPLEDGYTGKCHLCVDVRRHLLKARAFVDALLPQQFYESF